MWWRTSNCSSLLIYRPREDERLSWPGPIDQTTDTRFLICGKTQWPAIHNGLILHLHLGKYGGNNWRDYYFLNLENLSVWILYSVHCHTGLVISISMSILSTILLMYRYRYRQYFRIKVSIAVSTILCWPFLSTLHRYFSTDMQNDAHNFLSFRAFVRVQCSVEIVDERRITCNKI